MLCAGAQSGAMVALKIDASGMCMLPEGQALPVLHPKACWCTSFS